MRIIIAASLLVAAAALTVTTTASAFAKATARQAVPAKRSPVNAEEFDQLFQRVKNWGRWGADDELGTLNLITPECVAHAATLARTGRVFDLGYTLASNGPQVGIGGRINPVHLMSMTGQSSFPDGGGFADDFIFMPLQCATQWDGLAHVFYDEQCYNGVPTSSITARGAQKLAIDALARGHT